MRIGIVCDTHNNLNNIETIISLFNDENVELVIHAGDIANAKSLDKFSELNCNLFGVYGNNDRNEKGLNEIAQKNSFNIQEPPHKISIGKRNVAVFHEPDEIDTFLEENPNIDLVLHGHTHRYREEYINQTLIFNPGECAGIRKGKNAIGVVDLKDLSVKRIFF